jgi:hypothetical protein
MTMTVADDETLIDSQMLDSLNHVQDVSDTLSLIPT